MALVTSSRFAIQYPDPSRVDRPDIPLHLKNIVDSLEANGAMFGQGTFANRPPSSAGTQGKQGRFYMSSDGTGGQAGTYLLFYDYGTGWSQITSTYGGPGADTITSVELAPNSVTAVELADNSVDMAAMQDGAVGIAEIANTLKPSTGAGSSTEALRALGMGAGQALSAAQLPNIFQAGPRTGLPANNVANDGLWYYATDQDTIYFGAGGTWHRIGAQAGDVIWTFENTARTGYIICTGQAWPSTTGPYADLFGKWAALYPTTLPDLQGRSFVAKGTHADVATLGFNDGVAVASRRPKHKHTKNGAATVTGANSSIGLGGANSSIALVDPYHSHPALAYPAAGGGASGVTGFNMQTASNQGNIGTSQNLTGIYLSGSNSSLGLTGANSSIGVSDTITVGPQTGAEPVDTPAYIVLIPQVKL